MTVFLWAMGEVWSFLKAIPLKVWLILAALLFVVWLRSHWIGVGEERVQADFDAYKAEMVRLTKAAKVAAELAEQKQAIAFAAIADQHKRDLTDAKAKGDAVAAGLRAGSLRMRNHWTCPNLPQAAAGSEGTDGAARLREASVGRIIGAGAECDARIRALQAVIEAERQ